MSRLRILCLAYLGLVVQERTRMDETGRERRHVELKLPEDYGVLDERWLEAQVHHP